MTTVVVTTATKLSSAQRQKLLTALKSKVQGDLELEEVVDPEIIGGIRVRVGSRELDGTVKTLFAQLHRQLLTQL